MPNKFETVSPNFFLVLSLRNAQKGHFELRELEDIVIATPEA